MDLAATTSLARTYRTPGRVLSLMPTMGTEPLDATAAAQFGGGEEHLLLLAVAVPVLVSWEPSHARGVGRCPGCGGMADALPGVERGAAVLSVIEEAVTWRGSSGGDNIFDFFCASWRAVGRGSVLYASTGTNFKMFNNLYVATTRIQSASRRSTWMGVGSPSTKRFRE